MRTYIAQLLVVATLLALEVTNHIHWHWYALLAPLWVPMAYAFFINWTIYLVYDAWASKRNMETRDMMKLLDERIASSLFQK